MTLSDLILIRGNILFNIIILYCPYTVKFSKKAKEEWIEGSSSAKKKKKKHYFELVSQNGRLHKKYRHIHKHNMLVQLLH